MSGSVFLNRRFRYCRCYKISEEWRYLASDHLDTEISSTSKINVALGPIGPQGVPCSPLPSWAGMKIFIAKSLRVPSECYNSLIFEQWIVVLPSVNRIERALSDLAAEFSG